MRLGFPTMSEPKRPSAPTKPEDLLVYVEWLRQQAEGFGRRLEAEIRWTHERIFEELVRQDKGGDHDR